MLSTLYFASLLLLLFLVGQSGAHNMLLNLQMVCSDQPGGGATGVNIMMFNDYGLTATFTTSPTSSSGWPYPPFPNTPPFTLQFGCTPGTCCTPSSGTGKISGCNPSWDQTVPAWGSIPCGPGLPCNYFPYTIPLTNTGSASSPNYSPVVISGYALWSDGNNYNPWCSASSGCSNGPSGLSLLSSAELNSVAQSQCPPDNFKCPKPQTTGCGVQNCRCNSFNFLNATTDSTGVTTISINVTNYCSVAFYYAAFGIDGLTLVSASSGAYSSGYSSYSWTISTLNGTKGSSQPTTPPAYWLRFNAPTVNGNTVGNSQMTNSSNPSHGQQWDVFTFQVKGYTPSYEWTVQGHEGGYWDTYQDVNVGTCFLNESNGCPPGFGSPPDCNVCDTNPLPGGNQYTWLCVPNSPGSSNPYILEKVPSYEVGSGGSYQYQTPPDFVPYSVTSGAAVDAEGYTITCDCKRVICNCSQNDYCSGNGACVPQDCSCNCSTAPAGSPAYQPGNCAPTPPPPPTTTVPLSTAPITPPPPGATTPVPTTPVPTPAPPPPPCYNDGVYCSGHGTCSAGGVDCSCTSPYSNPASGDQDCSVYTAPPPAPSCTDNTDCGSCQNDTALSCAWCLDVVGGGCVPNTSCVQVLQQCNVQSVNFVPEPCPDDCSGPKHGICVNLTCSYMQQKGMKIAYYNGKELCINASLTTQYDPQFGEVTVEGANTSFCICYKGYNGLNCGGRGSSLGTALAISGGIIAVICICGVIFIVLIGFGAKKGVDWVMLNQTASANFHQNPIACDRDTEMFSGIHEPHGGDHHGK